MSIDGAPPDDEIREYNERFRTALLRRMRARLDNADAEDVVQEVFLQAFRDVGRYDPSRSAPATWLTRIGEQVLLRYFRTLYRRRRLQGESGLRSGQVNPLDIEEREDIRRLLDRLTPLNHRIVAGRFLLGETDEEFAIHTGLEPATVRQRISRSLKVLRRLAAEQGTSPPSPDVTEWP